MVALPETEGGEETPRTFAEMYLPAKSALAWEDVCGNVTACIDRGITIISEMQPEHGRPLAVVGGGPSTGNFLDDHTGQAAVDVWAINRSHKWLAGKGIDSLLFSVDPDPCLADCVHGGALLSALVDPSVWDAVSNAGADAWAFHQAGAEPEGYIGLRIDGSSSSACYAPLLALWLGYRDVTFYGCEGSFPDPQTGDSTHAYAHEPKDHLVIEIAGEHYFCNVDHLYQCERLSDVIRLFPGMYKEKSGGLLRAMIEHGKHAYRPVGASRDLFRQLWPGLGDGYDAPPPLTTTSKEPAHGAAE